LPAEHLHPANPFYRAAAARSSKSLLPRNHRQASGSAEFPHFFPESLLDFRQPFV
jgi:hypothetical protein